MSIPSKCRAAVIKKAGADFEIIEIDVPTPKAGEVLIKTSACGICHSDDMVVHKMMPNCTEQAGHEIIGKIVKLGENESHWKEGQLVGGAWHGGHCFTCKNCRRGDFATCENGAVNGISKAGGYAEYVILRSEAVIPIPDGMDPAEACPLLCAGITVFNSIRHMDKLHPGDLVGIQGIGGLGHLAIQFAAKMGYRVAALSSSESKKDLALKLGAHDYLDGSKVDQAEELNKLGGAKVIVCTAPNPEVINKLIGGLGVDGTLLVLAAMPDPISVSSIAMIQKRLSVRGWPAGAPAAAEDTLAFAKLHGVKCHIEKFKLEDVNKGFEGMMSGKARFRNVLVF